MTTLPEADWVGKIVTFGPPTMLVLVLAGILIGAGLGKIALKTTLVLSGIGAVFFLLWAFAWPEMNKRKVYIYATVTPQDLMRSYSLKPVMYRFGKREDSELGTSNFDFPDGRDPVTIEFDLNGLINSYDSNLRTVIRVARNDPQCFDQATRGVSYTQVAARIQELCPASMLSPTPPTQ